MRKKSRVSRSFMKCEWMRLPLGNSLVVETMRHLLPLKAFRLVIIWVYRQKSSKVKWKPLPNRMRSNNNKFSVEFSSLVHLSLLQKLRVLRTIICLFTVNYACLYKEMGDSIQFWEYLRI